MAIVKPGTPIAVIAPSGIFDQERFERGLAIAADFGHKLVPVDDILAPHRYLAGPDAHRLGQLVHALRSDAYGAVWAARGGYGLTRVIDDLPPDLPAKPIIGFSDLTALFCALPHHPHVHGPVVHSLDLHDERSLQHLFDLLAGRPTAPLSGEVWVEGEAAGRLVGGNLSMLAAVCGTRHQLDARGAILVLEEVGEAAYRVDRLLTQLRSAGVFEGVHGIALGTFHKCAVPPGADWTLRDVLRDELARLDVPVLAGLPIGHAAENCAFVWGTPARIADGTLRWDPPLLG